MIIITIIGAILVAFFWRPINSLFTRFSESEQDLNAPPVDLFGAGDSRKMVHKAEQAGRKIIHELIPQHFDTLMRKRRIYVYMDEYGSENDTRWRKELGYFVDKQIMPRLRAEFHSKAEWDKFLAVTNASQVKQVFIECLYSALSCSISAPNDPAIQMPQSGRDYEEYCSAILRAHGWKTHSTPVSGDQGADIIAEKGSIKAVIQCKFYNSPVGNKAVQEIVAAKMYYGAVVAVVVTNHTFTPAARSLASANGVILLHHDNLIELDKA